MLQQGPQLATKLHKTQLAITLIRSTIGRPAKTREIVKILGLKKINSTRVHEDSPRVWGLCTKAIHLIRIERIHAQQTPDVQPQE